MASCKLAGCFGEVLELGFCGAELAPHRNQLHRLLQDSGGGVLLENLGGGVRLASRNSYPIYDQNLLFSLPYFWPGQKFESPFMTSPLYQTLVQTCLVISSVVQTNAKLS